MMFANNSRPLWLEWRRDADKEEIWIRKKAYEKQKNKYIINTNQVQYLFTTLTHGNKRPDTHTFVYKISVCEEPQIIRIIYLSLKTLFPCTAFLYIVHSRPPASLFIFAAALHPYFKKFYLFTANRRTVWFRSIDCCSDPGDMPRA